MIKKLKVLMGGLTLAGLRTAVIALAAVCVVCFAACENPSLSGDDDGMAAFSLYLGGARSAAAPELYDHRILLTGGPGPEEIHTAAKGTTAITLRVLPGTWTITVQAYLNGALQYQGTTVQNITRGGNNKVSVTMEAVLPDQPPPVEPDQPAPIPQAPVMSSQPQDAAYHTGAEPGPLTINAAAQNGGGLRYQWYRDDDAVPGNGSAGEAAITGAAGTLQSGVQGGAYTPDTGVQGTYYYYVVVTDPANNLSVSSRTAVIVVNDQVNALTPLITVQPADAGYTAGEAAAALSVTASSPDGGTLSYQWYRNTVDSNAGGDEIPGATGGSYTPPVSAPGTSYYYVVVTNDISAVSPVDGGVKTISIASETAAVTVTAAYTVTFDSQGGNGVNAIDADHGGIIPKPVPDPEKTGCAFGGWYKEAACTTPWNFAADTVTSDITLYAKWILTYTVTFDGNAAIFLEPHMTITYEYGETLWEPTSPARPGYIFDGWYKEAVCITPWDFDTDTVTADTTLYAKWIYAGGAENDPVPVDNVTIANIGVHANYPLSGYYRLAVDITLNNWLAIGSDSNCFTGSFDGGGKTITFDGTARLNGSYAGLFGAIDNGGKVRNVKTAGILDVNSTSANSIHAGSIAGMLKAASIENCTSETNITVGNSNGTSVAGGIVGTVMDSYGIGKIKNCYTTGNVSAISTAASGDDMSAVAGGIVGDACEAIENCYAVGDVSADSFPTGDSRAGGIAGNYVSSTTTISNSVALMNLVSATGAGSSYDLTGGIAASLDSSPPSNCYANSAMITTSDQSSAYPDMTDPSATVAISDTQLQTWWSGTAGFSFGSDAAAPWKWDASLMRPVLWFEEEVIPH